MESLYILIPIAVVFLAVAIKAFLWAADNKQFDNLDQEAHRILFDEKPPVPQQNIKQQITADDAAKDKDSLPTDNRPT